MAARMGQFKPVCGWKRYLLQFAHHHLDFRFAEIKSIISLLGCQAKVHKQNYGKGDPFLTVELSNEQNAKDIMGRTLLGKSMYELWAEGSTMEELQTNIDQLPSHITDPYTHTESSFRIRIETFNKKISSAEKLSRIQKLTSGPLFKGKINLSSPDHSFHLLEFYKFDTTSTQRSLAEPTHLFFGRWIADGQRDKINDYHLQNRHFIANTSMDACLAMVMCNLGQVKPHDLVLDPFVGSGSLLVSSAHNGAFVMGTDIDYLLLHGKAKPSRAKQKTRSSDESVRSNLRQYGLEHLYVDVLVADASRHDMWRRDVWFDAIITDPPYGIREAAARIVRNDEIITKEDEGEPHYPQKVQYNLGDIFRDLLNFSAKFLKVGGYLVYWLPIYKPDYRESNIPSHPCLSLEFNCEQPLNSTISRRLITMVKVKDYVDLAMSPEEATIEVDHYAGTSFRHKYFKTPKNESTVERNESTVERNESIIERNESTVERNESTVERTAENDVTSDALDERIAEINVAS